MRSAPVWEQCCHHAIGLCEGKVGLQELFSTDGPKGETFCLSGRTDFRDAQ